MVEIFISSYFKETSLIF